MSDKYWVYRPLLDLIGITEGTDKGAGYDETLGYGAYTGGKVKLVAMTLDQLDALQTKMLKHPKNKLRSSACGRYQIVRTTLRAIRAALGLTGKELYDEDMQDRLACFLLGQRGIDKYLGGRLSEDTLVNNLAKEWASLPNTGGKGHYAGQKAAAPASRVRAALAEVKARHRAERPGPAETTDKVEEEVERKSSWWQKLLGLFGLGGGAGGFLWGLDWQTVAAIGGVTVLLIVIVVVFNRQVIAALRNVRDEMEGAW